MQEDIKIFSKKYFINISENIKRYRENKNFSQETLAEMVDCSREFINRLENKKEEPSLQMLLKLAFVLEVTPEQFFV